MKLHLPRGVQAPTPTEAPAEEALPSGWVKMPADLARYDVVMAYIEDVLQHLVVAQTVKEPEGHGWIVWFLDGRHITVENAVFVEPGTAGAVAFPPA